MSNDLRVALVTGLNDQLVGPLRRTLDEVERNLKRVEQDLTGVTQKGQQAGQTLGALQGPDRAAREVATLARNTQNATSLAERLKTVWSSAGSMIRGVASGIAAVQAARFVVGAAEPLKQVRTYDRALADAANTAFSDRTPTGRRAGMAELDSIVTQTLRTGGGNRDDVLAAMNEMLASGTVSAEQAKGLMPTVAKYATAGNASITELSNIVVRALQNGFKEADIPKVLDMALAAGQQGGFELKDMAKWLPKLLASGRMSGLTGMEGYARILASAQGSVITAGSKDEAGNNLLNLLLKINSSDTARDAKNLGIDLSGSLAAARGKGVNSLDAFVNLVEQIAGKDQRLVALRKQAAAAGSDEQKRATFSAQADILQGSAIGKIVQDRQALLSLVAELNKRDYIQGVKTSVMGANGQVGAANFDLIARTADFKQQQLANEKLFAQTRGLEGVNNALGKLAEGTTTLYRMYPELASAMEVAKVALSGLAAAAGAAAVAQFAMGGGGGVINLVKSVATGGTALAGSLAVGGAGVAAAGGVGYGAGMLINKGIEGTTVHDEIGKLATAVLAGFGNKDAQEALDRMADFDGKRAAEHAAALQRMEAVAQRPIKVTIDGREIAAVVNSYNELITRRH